MLFFNNSTFIFLNPFNVELFLFKYTFIQSISSSLWRFLDFFNFMYSQLKKYEHHAKILDEISFMFTLEEKDNVLKILEEYYTHIAATKYNI